MKYLFIDKDGSPYLVDHEPTEVDYDCVDNGVLDVIRVKDMKQSDGRGKWVNLATGLIESNPEGAYTTRKAVQGE